MSGKPKEALAPAPLTVDLSGQAVGFAGLGLMGKGMARRLKAAGATVHIWNRSAPARDLLAAEGMIPHDSPKALAAAVGAAPIVVMVADTAAVESVLFAPDGLAGGLAQGALVIDMGTTAVLATRDFADRIDARGAGYVDAPVSGGQLAADAGTMTVMAGGTAEDFARALPLLQVMGRTITHLGQVGSGQIAKVANQVIVALTIDAVAEAFAIAEAAGVEPARLREALLGGFAASRILDLHGARMGQRRVNRHSQIVNYPKLRDKHA